MNDLKKQTWAFEVSADEPNGPYLHDCTATRIEPEGSELSLYFPDGFWLPADDPRNPYGDTVHKTGPSLAVVSLGFLKPEEDPEQAITAELFRNCRICRGVAFTTVSYPDVKALMKKVNSGAWELEFVAKYPCCTGFFVESWFHTGKDLRKCYLNVECRGIRYYWNEVLEDRTW